MSSIQDSYKDLESTSGLNYDEHLDFNQRLDEQSGGTITIAGAVFQPSRILFEMESETYRLALQDFRLQKIEEFKESITEKFPTPIASNFYRLEYGAENDNQRLEILRDIWESLVFLLYALIVGEFRCSKLSMTETRIKRSELFSDKLHDKLSIITQLIRLGQDKGYQLACSQVIKVDVIEKLRELNRVRNEFAHSSALSEDQARRIVREHYEEVLSVLQILDGFRDVLLMRYIGQAGDIFKFRYERFIGHATNRTIREMSIKKDLLVALSPYLNDRTVLICIGEHIYSASPFLHFKKEDRDTRLCFFKKKEGETPNHKLIYEVIGEAGMIEISGINFTNEIDELFSLLPDLSSNTRGKRS